MQVELPYNKGALELDCPETPGFAGVLAGTAHTLIILAFRNAGASLLAPFNYTLLIWAVLYGWLLFRASSFEQILWMTKHASFATTAISERMIGELIFFATPLLLV